jgi:hypothetical protein
MKRIRLAIALLFAASIAGCIPPYIVDFQTCADACGTEPDPEACLSACRECAVPCQDKPDRDACVSECHACAEQCRLDPDPGACISECGTCSGECGKPAPEGFYGPALLWVGRTVDEPQCPSSAPITIYRGHETADFPFGCSPCRCSEPACALPDDLRTDASPKCGGSAVAVHDSRDILSGACVAPGEALANDRQSLVLGETRVTPCEASVEPPPVPQFTLRWYSSGVACGGSPRGGTCASPSTTCAPSEEEEEGFAECIMHLGEGEVTCPEDYPVDVVLYDGMRDERYCTPCECGPPQRSECSLMLLSFRDGECDDLLATGTASSQAPGCLEAKPGVTPQSMKAVWRVNQPGSCEPSGGELRGEIVLTGPSTFCCQTRPGEKA